jgi:hypothetical protein
MHFSFLEVAMIRLIFEDLRAISGWLLVITPVPNSTM